MPQKLPGNTKQATRRRLRNACFTINNPQVERSAFIQRLVDSGAVTYVIVGSEVGESGTPHFQGYVEFKDQLEFNIVHNWLLRGHIEPRKGTAQQAADYCKKDGKFDYWGTINAQGHRSNIDAVAAMVTAGESTHDIASSFPVQYVKYHKGIAALQSAIIPPRNTAPEVRVFYGTTGTGKSYQARAWLPDAYIWHPQQGQWFDGYVGQKQVIFEEFRGQIPFGMLLALLDRYCCRVQYKSGMSEFAAVEIAITSPLHPFEWYENLRQDNRLDQLLRRITHIEKCVRDP